MNKDNPIYAEFDDTDLSKWPFVSSAKARDAMRELVARHNLGFVYDAGGGVFSGDGWSCRITTNDDVADLSALRACLRDRGL